MEAKKRSSYWFAFGIALGSTITVAGMVVGLFI